MLRRALVLFALARLMVRGQADPLHDRWNDFAKAANEFVISLHAGKFDYELARKLSKLWRAIEESGEWPRQ